MGTNRDLVPSARDFMLAAEIVTIHSRFGTAKSDQPSNVNGES